MHQPAHFNMLSLSQAVHHVQGQSVYLRSLFLFYSLSLRAYIGENRYPGADTQLLHGSAHCRQACVVCDYVR